MIYIIITTSINNKDGIIDTVHRENRYIESIKALLTLIDGDSTIKPIIVENNGKRETYLNNLKCDIVYTNNNFLNFSHKGVNELLDIKDVINKYNILDEDTIIKLTGRYKILNLDFIELVKNNINLYDVFIKFFNVCTLGSDSCVLGLFAIKCKYLKEFNYNCVYGPETEFTNYVLQTITKIMEIKNLNLECSFASDHRILNV